MLRPVPKSQDEVEYERYAKFCASVPTNPMPFERWARRRLYQDHVRPPQILSQECLYNTSSGRARKVIWTSAKGHLDEREGDSN